MYSDGQIDFGCRKASNVVMGAALEKKRDAETLRNESEGFMKQSCSAVLIDGL